MSALAAIHVGRKALGLDEETYRDLLERVTGQRSAAGMNARQHEAVIAEMRRLGFAPEAREAAGPKRLDGPFARKLQALWIAGWNLGLVEDRRDAALLAFVTRQTGLSHTRFLVDGRAAAKAIEGLKAWLARDGGVDWGDGSSPLQRVCAAQERLLTQPAVVTVHAIGPVPDATARALEAMASASSCSLNGPHPAEGDAAGWIARSNALGRKVRAVAKSRRPRAGARGGLR